MAKRNGPGRAGARRNGRASGGRNAARFRDVGRSTSQIVRDAAALLDEEVAAGIVAAKRVHDRFQKERKIDPADLGDVLQRFQSDAHDIVNTLNEQFAELRSPQSEELLGRFVKSTHELLDLAVGMVNTGAEIANHLAQSNLARPDAKPAGARSRGARRR